MLPKKRAGAPGQDGTPGDGIPRAADLFGVFPPVREHPGAYCAGNFIGPESLRDSCQADLALG
ncbi:MAG: hypothetical protein ACJ8AI_27200 [Rhodopila sp.]